MGLTTIDWLIMLVYFGFVLGIGFVAQALHANQQGFFPGWPIACPLGCADWHFSRRIWALKK